MVGRPNWWVFLNVGEDGWSSTLPSVDLLLKHLRRRSMSVATRATYCGMLRMLCLRTGMDPDMLVSRAREDSEEDPKCPSMAKATY
jgi:hypothetical protein